jgi:hypothetical protein
MKLIFIHIEKSAGTSFRQLFKGVLGDKKVPWFAIDFNSKTFNEYELKESLLIGGHRGYAYYNEPDFAYLSVVREPIQRIISLYNFCKTIDAEAWKAREGFDEKSLNNTLKNCTVFRNEIKNKQCFYLSGTHNFESTKEHINKNKYLIGDFENLGEFNEALSTELSLDLNMLSKHNVGKVGYKDKLVVNKKTHELLEPLLAEDKKLYEYIVSLGLLNTIPAEDWLKLSGAVQSTTPQCMDEEQLVINSNSYQGNIAEIENEALENLLPLKENVPEKPHINIDTVNFEDIKSDLDINFLRDEAVRFENIDLEKALRLMELAYRARPDGSFIKKKVMEYRARLVSKT